MFFYLWNCFISFKDGFPRGFYMIVVLDKMIKLFEITVLIYAIKNTSISKNHACVFFPLSIVSQPLKLASSKWQGLSGMLEIQIQSPPFSGLGWPDMLQQYWL